MSLEQKWKNDNLQFVPSDVKCVCKTCQYWRKDKPGLCVAYNGMKPTEVLRGGECERYEERRIE